MTSTTTTPPRTPSTTKGAAVAPAATHHADGLDTLVLGRRIRHLRTLRGMTLDDLGAAIGRAASQVSMLENGHREPKLSLLSHVADALGVPLTDLLRTDPPRWRSSSSGRSAGPCSRPSAWGR